MSALRSELVVHRQARRPTRVIHSFWRVIHRLGGCAHSPNVVSPVRLWGCGVKHRGGRARSAHPPRPGESGLGLAEDPVHGRATDRALALGHVHAGLRDFHGALEVTLLLALHAIAVVRSVGHGSSSSCCRPGWPDACSRRWPRCVRRWTAPRPRGCGHPFGAVTTQVRAVPCLRGAGGVVDVVSVPG